MKGSRVLLNGKLIHRGGLWRRGRAMSERIGLIVIESKMTLRDIAFLYSETWSHISECKQMGPCYREHLSDVIKGTRKTPRYVKALEESWRLPIEDIRRIYREDKERDSMGEMLSIDEINEFADWYRSILKGKVAS
ncbi:hypothetical protein [Leptospira borgpetersenii]|uniref:hypothetical protein n=1 Tax=Leptospira borgpetersenii TaxID=174 RepID=UPI0018811AC4|nr:hypothetical protein [Leptospira borgpetersenii]MBE8363468.1 hypothetical protein [Leptospira borgpetersenii serovar Balcanica]MBE8367090.1 hypothetical protein [Leptospira borgpetersenii serovar Balcanica]MBE8422501.1 hypothetical protein [Leptospira borgpetersenii serovar Balcanica]MBF3349610.1 hypothetical protein [Leptospira borgpetersenii serovar Balcanica]